MSKTLKWAQNTQYPNLSTTGPITVKEVVHCSLRVTDMIMCYFSLSTAINAGMFLNKHLFRGTTWLRVRGKTRPMAEYVSERISWRERCHFVPTVSATEGQLPGRQADECPPSACEDVETAVRRWCQRTLWLIRLQPPPPPPCLGKRPTRNELVSCLRSYRSYTAERLCSDGHRTNAVWGCTLM